MLECLVLADFSGTWILWSVLWLLGAYLCGSIPFGFLAGKMKGVDMRKCGSGNIGATNVFRTFGWKIGLPVFILDFLKGFLPVYLAGKCSIIMDPTWASIFLVTMAMAAVLGHTFTCWLQFKGGKGVATGAGVVVALNPFAGLVVILVWAVVFVLTRYVSVASILGAATFPVAIMYKQNYFSAQPVAEGGLPILIFSFVIAALVIIKHRDNIKRLRTGTENKAFSKKKNNG